MAKSLKDQLMQAGFKTAKMENERDSAKGRPEKESEKHQVTRNFCEHCELIHPDVEHYKHRMPTTDAEWMCLACADKLMIDDKFRATHQSDMAKRKMFRRFFGMTKDFSRENTHGVKTPKKKFDDNRGNKGNSSSSSSSSSTSTSGSKHPQGNNRGENGRQRKPKKNFNQ